MLSEEKNLKDFERNPPDSYGVGMSVIIPYNKSNKLITALYMVTDIMDKEEPLRNKLRSLGGDILSDIYNFPLEKNVLVGKINAILSFLNIASTVGLISEMNKNILVKEFIQMAKTLEPAPQVSIEEFFKEEVKEIEQAPKLELKFENKMSKGHHSIGQTQSTRIGVQKGSTLMKALSDIKNVKTEFNLIKKERRENILNIVKDKRESTITDIMTQLKNKHQDIGAKTLQRELISMVHDGVLYRVGEKRWSKYFLPK